MVRARAALDLNRRCTIDLRQPPAPSAGLLARLRRPRSVAHVRATRGSPRAVAAARTRKPESRSSPAAASRTIRVAAAGASTDYPRGSRGGAATRPRTSGGTDRPEASPRESARGPTRDDATQRGHARPSAEEPRGLGRGVGARRGLRRHHRLSRQTISGDGDDRRRAARLGRRDGQELVPRAGARPSRRRRERSDAAPASLPRPFRSVLVHGELAADLAPDHAGNASRVVSPVTGCAAQK